MAQSPNLDCVTKLFTIAFLLTGLGFVTAQEPMSSVRLRPEGSVVTVRGIILNGPELGSVRFVQDTSGAIAAFPGGGSPSSFQQTRQGDSISLTGVLSLYHGLLEINPILSWNLLATGQNVPDPEERDIADLSYADQGKLLRLRCVVFDYPDEPFSDDVHTFYTSHGDRGRLEIPRNHTLVGSAIPTEAVDLIAIASYFDQWQFQVRGSSDFIPSGCFNILPVPAQYNIKPDGFSINWETSDMASGFVNLIDDDGNSTAIVHPQEGQAFTLELQDLLPAHFYSVQVHSVSDQGDTARYPWVHMSTASVIQGSITTYFNHGIDSSYSRGLYPTGVDGSDMIGSVMDVIAGATTTIDIATYNNSRSDIISALEQAVQRGVRVRCIADGDQSNSALDPLPDFPVLFRGGDGIMHNKFLVVDSDDPDKALVWTGSTNHSTNQLFWDPNNTLIIRDHAFARLYQQEFNEMWGGVGDMPDLQLSRTGSTKSDNSPHIFNIGGTVIEVYFSPSDATNGHIRRALRGANDQALVGLLLLTRTDLGQALGERRSAGVDVRVIVEDFDGSYNALQEIISSGATVEEYDFSAIFHHKYAILDEGTPTSKVITGSHNWTTSATTINDENTLILHSPDITNLYRQEFEARWKELVPTLIVSPVKAEIAIYPNPATELIHISSPEPLVSADIVDLVGELCLSPRLSRNTLDVGDLVAGVYFIRLRTATGMNAVLRFVKI